MLRRANAAHHVQQHLAPSPTPAARSPAITPPSAAPIHCNMLSTSSSAAVRCSSSSSGRLRAAAAPPCSSRAPRLRQPSRRRHVGSSHGPRMHACAVRCAAAPTTARAAPLAARSAPPPPAPRPRWLSCRPACRRLWAHSRWCARSRRRVCPRSRTSVCPHMPGERHAQR